MSEKSLFEAAIADAKTLNKVALENAKLVMQETFEPTLKSMLSAALQEELEEELTEKADCEDDKKEPMDEKKEVIEEKKEEDDEVDENLDLTSLLKELETDENDASEAINKFTKGDSEIGKEEDKDEKPVSNEAEVDPKEAAERALYDILKKKFEGGADEAATSTAGEDAATFSTGQITNDPHDSVGEEADIDALIRELEQGAGDDEEKPEDDDEVEEGVKVTDGDKKIGKAETPKTKPVSNESQVMAELNEIKKQLGETNLLNAKLLYFTRIIKENDSLKKEDKVKLLKQFDKASTVKEVKFVYETNLDSLKNKPKAKNQIKESMAFASKSAGVATQKDSIIDPGMERWQILAGIKPNKY